MMADVTLAAVQIILGDEPAAWERLGFSVGADGVALEGVRLRPVGAGELRVLTPGLTANRPDGLAIEPGPQHPGPDGPAAHPDGSIARPGGPAAGPDGPAAHPNGAFAVDHVVALTDSLSRTVGALVDAGLDLRRSSPPMAFLRLGPCILEVVERPEVEAPFLWGLVVVVPELPASEWVGEPRDAVQRGRRIATVRREAGLSCALAFMTPRPQPAPAR
jgi:hypothetical protein